MRIFNHPSNKELFPLVRLPSAVAGPAMFVLPALALQGADLRSQALHHRGRVSPQLPITVACELGAAISCNPKATEPRLLRRRGYAKAEFSAAGKRGLKSLIRSQFRFLEQEGSGGLDG